MADGEHRVTLSKHFEHLWGDEEGYDFSLGLNKENRLCESNQNFFYLHRIEDSLFSSHQE